MPRWCRKLRTAKNCNTRQVWMCKNNKWIHSVPNAVQNICHLYRLSLKAEKYSVYNERIGENSWNKKILLLYQPRYVSLRDVCALLPMWNWSSFLHFIFFHIEDLKFDQWGPWSFCSQSCSTYLSPAVTSRRRTCLLGDGECKGATSLQKPCGYPDCPSKSYAVILNFRSWVKSAKSSLGSKPTIFFIIIFLFSLFHKKTFPAGLRIIKQN